MKYIYKLFIGYHKKNRLEYDSVLSEVYFSREEAIEAGKNNILSFIKNRTDTETAEEFISNYDYEFRVSVINLNRKKINDLDNRWEYIKNNIPDDKSKIYDFLTSVAEEVYEIYDYNGYFVYGIIDPWEMELSYKSNFEPIINLKVGDIVRKVGYSDLYRIIRLPKVNENDVLSFSDIVSIAPIDNEDETEIYSYTELIKI